MVKGKIEYSMVDPSVAFVFHGIQARLLADLRTAGRPPRSRGGHQRRTEHVAAAGRMTATFTLVQQATSALVPDADHLRLRSRAASRCQSRQLTQQPKGLAHGLRFRFAIGAAGGRYCLYPLSRRPPRRPGGPPPTSRQKWKCRQRTGLTELEGHRSMRAQCADSISLEEGRWWGATFEENTSTRRKPNPPVATRATSRAAGG